VNPKLRWVLTLTIGIAAAVFGGWLCWHLWPGVGGWISAAAVGFIIAAVAIPLLDDCRREMR
jgi:membrane associated rhomboid family serine protease